MNFPFSDLLSRKIAYRIWDRPWGALRLAEMARLQRTQWQDVSASQEQKLFDILAYAYEHCPYYRRRGPAPRTMEEFRRAPILTKDEVRAHGDELISSQFSKDRLVLNKTGGSTGVSLHVYCDEACQMQRNAAALLSDSWSGWRPGEIRGALWGNPPVASSFKERLRSLLLDRMIYLDTIDMNAASMDDFIRALVKNGVRTIYGHSHSLFVFANHVAARGLPGLGIRSIVSTSMVLLPAERQRIEEVFGCRVNDRYGCEEVSLIASECEAHEGLHVNMDHIYLEVLRPDGQPAAPGEEGAVVVTGMINRGQPLIRYAVGDVAVRSPRSCSCGRKRPLLERVVGRTADFLVRPDGSLVAGVSLVERTLTAIPGIAQMQIVQDRTDELVINVVPDDKYGEPTRQALTEEMRRVFGEGVAVTVRAGDRIHQEKNGKYRFAICRVSTRYQEAAR
jgi:phenylacetate-CoA ligase